MADGKIEKVIAGMSPTEKKEFLNKLVMVLLKDLNETEKEEMLHAVATGRKEGRKLAALVDE